MRRFDSLASMSGASSFSSFESSMDNFSRRHDSDEKLEALNSTITSASSSSSALLRRRFSIPIALVLQALFVLSIVVVLSTACAIYISFVNNVRSSVGEKLLDQLASCTANRLSSYMTEAEMSLLEWQRDSYFRQVDASSNSNRSGDRLHFASLWRSTVRFAYAQERRLGKRRNGTPSGSFSKAALLWGSLLPRCDAHDDGVASSSNTSDAPPPPPPRRWPMLSSCDASFGLSVSYACDPANVSLTFPFTNATSPDNSNTSNRLCPNAGVGVNLFYVRWADPVASLTIAAVPLSSNLVDDVDDNMTISEFVAHIRSRSLSSASNRDSIVEVLHASKNVLLEEMSIRFGFAVEASCFSIMLSSTLSSTAAPLATNEIGQRIESAQETTKLMRTLGPASPSSSATPLSVSWWTPDTAGMLAAYGQHLQDNNSTDVTPTEREWLLQRWGDFPAAGSGWTILRDPNDGAARVNPTCRTHVRHLGVSRAQLLWQLDDQLRFNPIGLTMVLLPVVDFAMAQVTASGTLVAPAMNQTSSLFCLPGQFGALVGTSLILWTPRGGAGGELTAPTPIDGMTVTESASHDALSSSSGSGGEGGHLLDDSGWVLVDTLSNWELANQTAGVRLHELDPLIAQRRVQHATSMSSEELVHQQVGATGGAPIGGVFRVISHPSPLGPANNIPSLMLSTTVSHEDLGTTSLTPLMFVTATLADHLLDDGEVQKGVEVMILLSVGIGVSLITIGSFFIQALARRIVKLAEDFSQVECFDVAEDALLDQAGTVVGSPVSAKALFSNFADRIKSGAASVRQSLGKKRMHHHHHRKQQHQKSTAAITVDSIRGSMFREVDGVCKGLRMLVRHILTLKRFAPSSILDAHGTTSDTFGGLNDDEEDGGDASPPPTNTLLSVFIAVRYESRSTSIEFSRAEFYFSFDPDEVTGGGGGADGSRGGGGASAGTLDGDDESSAISASQYNQRKTLYARLVAACVEHCGEDPFQLVTLTYVSPKNEHVVLRTSLQVVEIFSVVAASSSTFSTDQSQEVPGGEMSFEASASQSLLHRTGATQHLPPHAIVRLTMHKTTTPKVMVPFTICADVFNVFSTAVFVLRLLVNEGANPGVVAFCCLYVFALSTNSVLCLVFVRQLITRDASFALWVERRSTELRMCSFFSVLNLQNLELMWSGIRIERHKKTMLFFNAPPNDDAIFKSIQWSFVGFLFSDVSQLIFKAWVIVSSKVVQVETILALVTSTVSVLFNIAVKLHATFLWTRAVESNVLWKQQRHRDGGGGGGEEDEDIANTTLVQRECSVVYVRMKSPDDVHQLSLLAVEWGQCYEAVLSCARAAKATVLLLNSGTVLLALNATRSSSAAVQQDHESAAVHLSLRIKAATEQCAPNWSVAIVVHSGLFLTGVLGSFHKKATHVLITASPATPTAHSPLEVLARTGVLVQHQSAHGIIMVSGNVARNALGGVELGTLVPGAPHETSEYVGGECLMIVRPAQMFASLRKGGGPLLSRRVSTESGSAVSPTASVTISWPEFAFLYRSDESPPVIVDSRTRFLTAAFGWSELNMERLRIGMSRLFERGWHHRGGLAVPTGSSRTLPPLMTSKRAGLSYSDVERRGQGLEDGSSPMLPQEDLDSDEDDSGAEKTNDVPKRRGMGPQQRSNRGMRTASSPPRRRRVGEAPLVVVSPRKLFGLL